MPFAEVLFDDGEQGLAFDALSNREISIRGKYPPS